jgi:hypothetical protein
MMLEATDLKRGEWRIEDDDAGFTVTLRPRFGPLSIANALYLLVGVMLVLVSLAQLFGTEGVPPKVMWGLFVLICIYGTLRVAAGSIWLAFGWTTLSVHGTHAAIHLHNHALVRRRVFREADIRTLGTDRAWVRASLGLMNQTGELPERGPLTMKAWPGGLFHFGGNLSASTADSVTAAVAARVDRTKV